jgi:hypothetical protein
MGFNSGLKGLIRSLSILEFSFYFLYRSQMLETVLFRAVFFVFFISNQKEYNL